MSDEARDPTEEVAGDEVQATSEASSSGEPWSDKRMQMLALIDKWMPTSLSQPRIPDGETRDLMALAGWTRQMGEKSKQDKDNGGPVTTSCGDVLRAMLKLWGSTFEGAFMIRDLDARGKPPGAKGLGYYVEANKLRPPKPGDILVLRNGVGKSSTGSVGHVCILVDISSDWTEWTTADGGAGLLPDQAAKVSKRKVRLEDDLPIFVSPTDGKDKQLDGWVDLDLLPQVS